MSTTLRKIGKAAAGFLFVGMLIGGIVKAQGCHAPTVDEPATSPSNVNASSTSGAETTETGGDALADREGAPSEERHTAPDAGGTEGDEEDLLPSTMPFLRPGAAPRSVGR